jgi:peptidoglycan/xylan/chitin deacetylase (PgdA/CDA1 family)
MTKVLFTLQIDCESTQHAINDAGLGERSIRGLGEILQQTSTKGTFMVIPSDIEIHASIYRELEKAGHEIGLHLHPADLGYDEFLGVQSGETQLKMIREAADRFAQVMGCLPKTFCPGYASANDHTFGVLEELGFTHGMVSIPTRQLAQCASLWAGAPLDPHYPHRYNRCLTGDVNFVELPPTVDPDSRMWGGLHPQDLRVELVDAKNHWYTMHKAVNRQLTKNTPLCQLHALTHNVFDFSEPQNFRRETYLKMTEGAKHIAEENHLIFESVTLGEMAQNYRALVPLENATAQRLELDARGRAFHSK